VEYVILSLAIALLGLLLAHISFGVFRLKFLTISKVFYLTYFIIVYIPSIFVYFNVAGKYKVTFLTATTLTLIFFPLGALTINVILGNYKITDRTYYEKPLVSLPIGESYWRHTFSWFLLSSIILVMAYLLVVSKIALLEAILYPHTYLYLAKAREESFKLLKVGGILKYLFTWLRVLILPYLSLISFLSWYDTRKNFWLWSFFISLIMALFYASLSLAKMPVAWVVLLLAISYYVARQGNVSIKMVILFILSIFIFPVFVVFIVMPWPEITAGYSLIISGIFRRIFWVPAWVLYHYFEVFPEHIGFLYGRSISLLSLFQGESFFPVSNFVYHYMNPEKVLSYGLANAPFIGNLYADFGLAGVICGSFFIGMLSEFLHNYLTKKSKNPIYVATYAYLIGAFYLMNNTALTVVLNTNGLIWVFVILFAMRVVEEVLRNMQSGEKINIGKGLA
jgi:oligosaccharide repeat unit polymerase